MRVRKLKPKDIRDVEWLDSAHGETAHGRGPWCLEKKALAKLARDATVKCLVITKDIEICGFFAFRLAPDRLECVHYAVTPFVSFKSIMDTIFDFLLEFLLKSRARKKVVFYLWDRKSVHIEAYLRYFQGKNCTITLKPDHYCNNIDAWEVQMTPTAAVERKKTTETE